MNGWAAAWIRKHVIATDFGYVLDPVYPPWWKVLAHAWIDGLMEGQVDDRWVKG